MFYTKLPIHTFLLHEDCIGGPLGTGFITSGDLESSRGLFADTLRGGVRSNSGVPFRVASLK